LGILKDDAKEYVEWVNTKTDMRLNPDIAKPFPIFKKGVYYIRATLFPHV
jgi:hypothetical protein